MHLNISFHVRIYYFISKPHGVLNIEETKQKTTEVDCRVSLSLISVIQIEFQYFPTMLSSERCNASGAFVKNWIADEFERP